MRILLCILVLLTSCKQQKRELVSIRGVEMTIPFRISVAGPLSQNEINALDSTVFQTFRHIDQLYNNWNKDSEVSLINNSTSNVEIPISHELSTFLHTCEQYVQASKGRFDPSIAPSLSLWKKAFDKDQIPSQDDINEAKKNCGWNNFTIKEFSIVKKHDACALDLGAITKGYAVDCLVESLKQLGFSSLFVEWGGEIRTVGKHPSNRPWSIYIANFEDVNPKSALEILSMQNEAVAISGDYLKHYRIGSHVYTHIIDTQTMQPTEIKPGEKQSITVLAPTCLQADAIATWILSTPDEYRANVLKDIQQQFPQCEVHIYVHVPESTNTHSS